MSRLKDKSIDLAIVDPPYGIKEDGRKTKGRHIRKDGSQITTIDSRTGKKIFVYKEYKAKNWDEQPPPQEYYDELFRVAKYVIIWGCNYLNFNQKSSSSGRIFWDKVNGDNDFSDGEIAWTNLFSSIRQVTYMWNGMLQGKSIKEGHISQGNKKLCEKRIQTCQKPVILYKWLLGKYAKPGYTILDTHLGSGSIAIACYDLGYNLIACEKDTDNFTAAMKRIKIYTQQLKLEI